MKIRWILAGALLAALGIVWAQTSDEVNAIMGRVRQLRSLPDEEWTASVGEIARQIHAMPNGAGKQGLIGSLVNLATEGDAGQATLQTIADTIVEVFPGLPERSRASLGRSLANLARYEHVKVLLDDPLYRAALEKLDAADQARTRADFTLSDITGKAWTLSALRGKVVLVNFWATWCPPCRKEMPDMQALYERFAPRGLVILAISDETHDKVDPFIAEKKYTYPILLDPDRKVNTLFTVEGIPKSFVYDRSGNLVAEAIDRRTNRQFLGMLKLAGLQ